MSEESSDDENLTSTTNELESVSESVSEETSQIEDLSTEEGENKSSASPVGTKTPEICHRPGEGGDQADIDSPDIGRHLSTPISKTPASPETVNTEEPSRSLTGAFQRLLDPRILSIFIIIVAGFLALPFKAIIASSFLL